MCVKERERERGKNKRETNEKLGSLEQKVECVRAPWAFGASAVVGRVMGSQRHLAVLGAVGDVLALSAQQHLVEHLAAVCVVAQPDRPGQSGVVARRRVALVR